MKQAKSSLSIWMIISLFLSLSLSTMTPAGATENTSFSFDSTQSTLDATGTDQFHHLSDKITLSPSTLSPTMPFEQTDLNPEEIVEVKRAWRDQFLERQVQYQDNPDLLARMGPSDNLKRFFRGEDIIEDLKAMEQKGLLKAKLNHSPWSASYWPTYRGVIAERYATDVPKSQDWQVNHDHFLANPADTLPLDKLSPSEKYEKLVGMNDGLLSKNMWGAGAYYYNKHGEVETWFGICHGWAPASYMFLRPKKAVTVTTADGEPLTFYPEDIKALASLLWAHGDFRVNFLGARCRDKEPEADNNERITDEKCFNNNPGAWHMAVVNQIGHLRKNLILDVIYDYQVWNQPIVGYSYSYFNPQTRRTTQSLEKARVDIDDFTADQYKQYRASETDSVVGIAMEVTYGVTREPLVQDTDSDQSDVTQKVRYVYDLELDRRGKIIGGEWYQKRHPDFVWTPPLRERATTPGDKAIRSEPLWDGKSPLGEKWQSAARTSAKSKLPLAKLVESLFYLSNQ